MSGHQLGSANGSATLWRGRRWLLLRCRADIAPGFSAPGGREDHHPAHSAQPGHPNGQRKDPPAAPPQLADPVRHVGHRGEALASLWAGWPTTTHTHAGHRSATPTGRGRADADLQGGARPSRRRSLRWRPGGTRPRRLTWPSATCDRWTSRGRDGLLTGSGRPRPAWCRGPADAELPTSRSPRWSICTPKTPPVRAREGSYEHPA
jgi:hypothetical protein